VVLADVEEARLSATVAELGKDALGEVIGIPVDVTSPSSVDALASSVYERFGAVHVLINNAGVGAPSAKPWDTTPNDWRWVHSVNVYGVAYGIQAFVPRMIASGEPGWVVNTSSGDGAVNPLPGASVYAASKAAVATLTECLAAQLASDGVAVGASLFLPGGGLLDTGLWTADRNRPASLARERPRSTQAITVATLVEMAAAKGHQIRLQPLDELAGQVVEGIKAGTYSITSDVAADAATLRTRAERIAAGTYPTLTDGHGILG
jgi:NAD(P)-dependent dehydrogenase (short-subunit alcohol dehydrogenase family)